MGVERERFTREEASKHRHSDRLAACLVGALAYDRTPLYDFGCGDGYYLQQIRLASRSLKPCIGVDASIDIPNPHWPYIIHPCDAAVPLHLGPPGDVICLEVAEHIRADRLNGLLANLESHCRGILVLSWAVRGQAGTRHVSCRDEHEVMAMVLPLGFRYLKDTTLIWREEAGQDLWWFKKSLYLFQHVHHTNHDHPILGKGRNSPPLAPGDSNRPE